MKAILALAALLCLAGCSLQKGLVHQIKAADRVVVTNSSQALSITITGEQVDQIIRAIESGKKESPFIKSKPGFRLEFFKEAEHLGTIKASHLVFWIEHVPYVDSTDTLKGLYDRFNETNGAITPR